VSTSSNGIRYTSATAARAAAANAARAAATDTSAQGKRRAALSKQPYKDVRRQARQAMKQHPGEKPADYSFGSLIDLLLKVARSGG
jgi:hypothetical protein